MTVAKITSFFTKNGKGLLIALAVIVVAVLLFTFLKKGIQFLNDPFGLDGDKGSKEVDVNIPPDTNVGTSTNVQNVEGLVERLIEENQKTYPFLYGSFARCNVWKEVSEQSDRSLSVIQLSYEQATGTKLIDDLEGISVTGTCSGISGGTYRNNIISRLQRI